MENKENGELTLGNYPCAQFTRAVALNDAASETRTILSKEMNEAIKDVVRRCIEEQIKPGGLLHRR